MANVIDVNNISTLCILRLSAIGDVTHVLPIIASLKKAKSDLKISWVVGVVEHKLLKGLPGVDFIVFDKNSGLKGLFNLRKKFKNKKFNALLQMQLSFRANLIAQFIPAKIRIGFDKKRSKELHSFRLTHRIRAVDKQHVLDSFMEFAKVLGVNQRVLSWGITYSSEDEAKASEWIKPNQINVVLSPCSSHKTRNWRNQRYAEICDFLVEKYNANVLLCGGPSEFEKQTSQKIVDLCQSTVVDITGQDTLKQLFVTLKKADLVITPDSGPAHIANAAGTPVIVIHASTTSKRSGAYSYQDLAVDKFDEAAVQYAKKKPDEIRWGSQIRKLGVMDLISVESVKVKIAQVLDE